MTQNGLIRRIADLENRLPADSCSVCAARPVFTIGGPTGSCPACGREPFVFTIDIDRTSSREGDAA